MNAQDFGLFAALIFVGIVFGSIFNTVWIGGTVYSTESATFIENLNTSCGEHTVTKINITKTMYSFKCEDGRTVSFYH